MTTSGVTPRYRVPFTPSYSPEDKITQVLKWIDLPLEQRPRLITVYEPMLDQGGHKAGPESELVNKTLASVSNFARALVQSLHNERNLSHIVDILFDARQQGWPTCAGVRHVDGWPSMGLWFEPGINTTAALSHLVLASESGKFDVYTTDTYTPDATFMAPKMPERYHYSSSPRLAPIWVIPRMGYALTDRVENGSLMSIGNHGYDNDAPCMRAVFISQGPFAESVRKRFQEDDSDRTKEWVLPPFQNVELYNLVVRLLGIDRWAAETNGTEGFWDRWTGF